MSYFQANVWQHGEDCLVKLIFLHGVALTTSYKQSVTAECESAIDASDFLTDVGKELTKFLLTQSVVLIISAKVDHHSITLRVNPADVADDGLQVKFSGLNSIIASHDKALSGVGLAA